MPATQPTAPQSEPNRMTASKKSIGSLSKPPNSCGCSMRMTPISRIFCTVSAGNWPSSSASAECSSKYVPSSSIRSMTS